MESTWPSGSSNARVLWRRLRHLIIGVAKFKRSLSSQSQQSLASGDYDTISRDSMDSTDMGVDRSGRKKLLDG